MAVQLTQTPEGVARGEQLVTSYDSYQEAQRAVDRLSDERFPVERVQIMGRGVTLVEQVTGRRDFGSVAIDGALTGAVVSGLVGLLFGLLSWFDTPISALQLGLYGFVFGAAVGSLIGLLAHWLTRGRRDFASVRSMRADRYDVLADADVADEARRLLTA
jgi:uncharacterized membrane protein